MYEDFAKYGRILFEQGLNNSHSGNMSLRQDDAFYITRHGAQLGSLTFNDIVKVNLKDTQRDANASLEVKVHRAIYGATSFRAIAHAHNPHAIALSLHDDWITPVDAEGAYYLPRVPVLACGKSISSDEVAEKLPDLLTQYKAAVVRGHGAFAAAGTMEEAALLISVLESASRIIYLDRQLQQK